MRLYGHGVSGNVYKPQLLMAHLGIEYEFIHTSWEDGGTQGAEYLRLNPNGKVPALIDDDFILWESGAILHYLAQGTSWWPDGRRAQAKVLQWMFFEQYSHEPYIATSRAILHYHEPGPERDAKIAAKRKGGEHALGVMDAHLADHDWFVGDRPTMADIALYAYTHSAPEGGFDLAPYANIRAWLARMAALPGHIAQQTWHVAS